MYHNANLTAATKLHAHEKNFFLIFLGEEYTDLEQTEKLARSRYHVVDARTPADDMPSASHLPFL